MPVTNWPPAGITWPPPEYPNGVFWSNALDMIIDLRAAGWTLRVPTTAERNLYFTSARCDEGHQVVGRMAVSPSDASYPFAICNNAAHRQLLVLWGPDYCMGGMLDRNELALLE